jgi:hypothetical protein
MDNQIEIALQFASMGFRVFPQDRNKHPCIKEWPEKASTDPEQVRRWAKEFPKANFATALNDNQLVLDVDVKKEQPGLESFGKLEWDVDLPQTLAVRTPSGGKHLYFTLSGNHKKILNRPIDGYPGIEVKTAGGCVTLPGSLYANGAEYVLEEDLPAAEAPEAFLKLLKNSSPVKKSEKTAPGETIAAGERNNTLISLAGTMRHRGMSDEAVLQALLAENQERCDPPLSESEVQSIAESASRYEPGEKDAEPEIELISLEEERTADIPPRTWFVEGMVTTGFNLVIAKKAIGKSFFVLDMAYAIAAGYDFLGQKTMQCDVLYVPTELDRIAVHERIQKYPLIPDNLFIHYCWTIGARALADAERVLKERKIRVLIFDMFLPLEPEIETNAYETSEVFLKWRKMAQKYEAAIVAVWHAGKTVRTDFMDAAIGTTGLIGQSDSIISLERKRTETGGNLWIGGNHGEERGLKVIFENCTWYLTGGTADDYLSIGDKELIRLVQEQGKLRAIDAAAVTSRPYDSVRIMLAKLHARQLIDRDGKLGPYVPVQTETDRNRPKLFG